MSDRDFSLCFMELNCVLGFFLIAELNKVLLYIYIFSKYKSLTEYYLIYISMQILLCNVKVRWV